MVCYQLQPLLMSVIFGLWQDLTEEMRDYWCRRGSNDCLNETANIHNSIQIDGKQKKIISQVHVLLFSAKWGKEEKKLALLFPKQAKHFASNASCFHRKIVLSPEVASATGKMPHSEWWLMRAVKPTGMLPWPCAEEQKHLFMWIHCW